MVCTAAPEMVPKQQIEMYSLELVLLATEEKVLQDMIDKIIEIGRYYGMEMNVEKTRILRILRQPLPVTIMIDQKQLENVESFKYLGSILTNDGNLYNTLELLMMDIVLPETC